MNNDLRGSADITIDGQSYEVGLSLGALARLASAFGLKTFDEVNGRVREVALGDIPTVLQCLLRGNGHSVSDEIIERVAPGAYFVMLKQLYKSAFPQPEAPEEGAQANPPTRKAKKTAPAA